MPLLIVQNDITRMRCDAIVNAANPSLLGGGGVDGAIHRAAGPELLEECRTLGGCETGQAKTTAAYRLPAKYVIHTVGPVWQGGSHGEAQLLRACYRNSLEQAVAHGCESVAFPLISAGVYGYPKAEAFAIAAQSVAEYLQTHELTVYLVIFNREDYRYRAAEHARIAAYLAANAAQPPMQADCMATQPKAAGKNRLTGLRRAEAQPAAAKETLSGAPLWESAPSLREVLSDLDESFSQMLLRKIDEAGMTDAACYKKANIDRKLFSKIRADVHYRPSKPTAIAFAIALELDLAQTKELLEKAGYALSHSSKFDLIIEYFIRNRNYRIYEINEALFAFDQPLLGA